MVKALLGRIDEKLREKGTILVVTIPASEGEVLAWCYRQGVIVSREDEDEVIHLTLRLKPAEKQKLMERFGILITSPGEK
jgi:GTP-binding protein HflX